MPLLDCGPDLEAAAALWETFASLKTLRQMLAGIGKSSRPPFWSAVAILGTASAIFVSPTFGHHIIGATYNGTVATGGTIQFTVTADGSAVTQITVQNLRGNGCTLPSQTSPVKLAISGDPHGFSLVGQQSLTGTFHADQAAQGTLRYQSFGVGACDTGVVSWTATTTAIPPQRTAPNTQIRGGPPRSTRARSASFRLASSKPGSRFQCKLDRGRWTSCRSPKTYRNLRPGPHVFRARAIDAAGNVDPTPAARSWRIR
jgi:hypothetical protein